MVEGFINLKVPIGREEAGLIFDFCDTDGRGSITLGDFFKFAAVCSYIRVPNPFFIFPYFLIFSDLPF